MIMTALALLFFGLSCALFCVLCLVAHALVKQERDLRDALEAAMLHASQWEALSNHWEANYMDLKSQTAGYFPHIKLPRAN
jgi:hypothetical protein